MGFGILNIILIIGLVRASRVYNEKICASIWAGTRFVLGLLAVQSLGPNIFWSAVAFCVAYVFFKFLRETDELSLKWFAILVCGIAGLLYL